MQFVCLIYSSDANFDRYTRADHERLDAANLAHDRDLQRRGHYVAAAALAPASDSVSVRPHANGLTRTDGPFAETKEHIGGFMLIEARDLAQAVELASEMPMAGVGGIEIRPAMDIGSPDWPAWAAERYGRT